MAEQAEGAVDSSTAGPSSQGASMMERFQALDLTLGENGVPQLDSSQLRRVFAYGLFHSKRAPRHFENAVQVEQGIELIQGMGMPAIANLRYVYFVGGHLTAMHKLCLAACQATGEMERYEVIHVDARNEPLSEKNLIGFEAAGCIVYVRRRGRTETAMGTFTMEQAKTAGMAGKNPTWRAYPVDMLMHRASIRALYQQFSDVLQGVRCKEDEEMHLVRDEQGHAVTSADGRPVFQKKAAQRQMAAAAFDALKEQ